MKDNWSWMFVVTVLIFLVNFAALYLKKVRHIYPR